jgi:hypothetical protein
MTPLRFRKLWIGIGMALVAVVAFLSLTPDPLDVGRVHQVKVGHFIAYGTLMLWFAQIFRSAEGRIGVGLSLALMGVVLEYLQGATGYRTFAYSDMRDNAIGVAAGLALAYAGLGGALGRLDAWLATYNNTQAR